MKHTTLILAFLLMLCSPSWSETVKNLVTRNELFYEKFSNIPFTGTVSGNIKGNVKNGTPDGLWEWYHDNGQLNQIGTYKDGKRVGLWRWYDDQGNLSHTATYKDGVLLE